MGDIYHSPAWNKSWNKGCHLLPSLIIRVRESAPMISLSQQVPRRSPCLSETRGDAKQHRRYVNCRMGTVDRAYMLVSWTWQGAYSEPSNFMISYLKSKSVWNLIHHLKSKPTPKLVLRLLREGEPRRTPGRPRQLGSANPGGSNLVACFKCMGKP